jgi:hypothetical protein
MNAANLIRETLRRSDDARISGMTLERFLVADTALKLFGERSAAIQAASFEDFIGDAWAGKAIAAKAEARLQAARKDAATRDLVALAVVEETDFKRRMGVNQAELEALVDGRLTAALEGIAPAVRAALDTRAAALPTEVDVAAAVSDQLEWRRAGHRIVVRDGVEVLEPLPLPSFQATFERDANRLTKALHVAVDGGANYRGDVARDAFGSVEKVSFRPVPA